MNAENTILSARNVGYAYSDRAVLHDVSVDVRAGEIFGLLGPNGSGKSTLLALLTGMRTLQSGQILLDGAPASPSQRDYRRSIGVVFQNASLDAKLSVIENLQLVATMYGYKGADAKERVQKALELARLGDRAKSVVGELSGGMRRRLDIARALLPEPRILLMDEPTTGLDEASYRALWTHLEDANRRTGVTIVLSTHRAEEAERCDRLCVIHQGVAAATASPAELCANMSSDLVVLTAADPESVAAALKTALDPALELHVKVLGNEVQIACEDGHALVPRIFEGLAPGSVSAAAVRRPGLADAYLALTGNALDREAEAT